MEFLKTLPSLTLTHMESVARNLGILLCSGDTITLAGEVGAGKTSFARALIQAISKDKPDVTSPTFNLMQSYDVMLADKQEKLWHLDLYRLEKERELEALGLEELWPHVVMIEWPEIATRYLPPNLLAIEFVFASPDTRTLTLRGNDTWRKRLMTLG